MSLLRKHPPNRESYDATSRRNQAFSETCTFSPRARERKAGPRAWRAPARVTARAAILELCESSAMDLRAPVHTLLLSAVQLVVFWSDSGSFSALGFRSGDRRASIALALLVHSDWAHLANNLAVQVPVGGLFEALHGTFATAFVFWLGGVFGLSVQALVMQGNVVLGGASPGCLALVSAFAGHLLVNWRETPFKWTAVALVSTYAVATVVTAVVSPERNVAHVAHLTGLGHGVLGGAAAVRNYVQARWERPVRLAAGALAVATAAVAFALL